MKHKGSMDPLLVGGQGIFNNGCFLGEVVIWMEKVSCVQPHVHEICCKLDARKKEIAIYKICNNSKASLKLRNKVYGVK